MRPRLWHWPILGCVALHRIAAADLGPSPQPAPPVPAVAAPMAAPLAAATGPDAADPISCLTEIEDHVVRIRELVRIRLDPKVPGGAVYEYSYGTGVLVGADGAVATANHVVRDRQKASRGYAVSVMTRDARNYVPADVIAQDPESDVALLRVNPRALRNQKHFVLDRPRQPRPGERSYVVGLRAAAAPDSFEMGIVAGSFVDATARLAELAGKRRLGPGPWITVSQMILQGYSGGAVLDASGNLVAILVGCPEWKGDWSEFSYGTGVEAILRLLEKTAGAKPEKQEP